MLSYLKGSLVGVRVPVPNRPLLILEANGIGYEVQVTPRWVSQLPAEGETLQVFVDLQIREERPLMFGFAKAAERDLFRQLIRASGVGSQLAMALLDTLALEDLVQAIVSGNHQILSQTPGVGKKTAERISLELRAKLSQWRDRVQLSVVPTSGLKPDIREDVELTLLTLGYAPDEVAAALNAVASDMQFDDRDRADAWIHEALSWLSQDVAT